MSDTRDSKTYVVRKLADGRCWMAQNLRLGGSSTITLTPTDSDVSTNFTLSASSSSFPTDNNAASINTNRMHNNGDIWLDGYTVKTTGTPPSQTQYMGNYYNWYTATAGTGTYSVTSGNATSSICPKGWRLPTGDIEQQMLYDTYNSYTSFVNITSTILEGYWGGSTATYRGQYSYLTSSTAMNSTQYYLLRIDRTDIVTKVDAGKRFGRAVRCIAN